MVKPKKRMTGPARALLALCRARGLKIAAAESCTGGLLTATLTEIPGSSDVVDRGFVTYSNQSKQQMLGVSARTLTKHGAVSRETARAMAQGALARSPAHLVAAITGIAGPGGGSPAKPVGLTYVAVADRGGHEVRRHVWSGTRGENKRASAGAALRLLLSRLEPVETG